MPEIDLTTSLIQQGTLVGTLAVGGGTTDYNALENKPSINSITLSGNKTGADLGLVSADTLATVATSGSYNDLTNKPTIYDFSVTNVGSQYTVTKNSGEWSFASVWARKCGNLVSMALYFSGSGNQTPSGSNAFKGTLSGGHLPVGTASLISYIQGSCIICQISSDGGITVRITGADVTLASDNTAGCNGVFMTTPTT